MRDNLDEATRRAILKALAGTVGVSIAGSATGHPGGGTDDHDPLAELIGQDHQSVDGVTEVGYHSLGRKGSESLGGRPEEPHYGGISELKVEGDLAFVGILSSREPTLDRGLAILDVSAYTRAESRQELERAEMALLSFVPNENQGTSVMDVKVSADRQYAFLSQQPIEALFQATGDDPDPETNPGADETSTELQNGSLKAVDVSDPGDPEVVGSHDLWGLGPHNSDHHRIGGDDYVFAVRGPLGEPAGVFVCHFDRTTGDLELVNYWTHDTQLAQGEVGYPVNDTYANDYEYYVHDVSVHDDPKTGEPLAYVANLNSGARVLDVSDPMDIEELGHFYCRRSHEIHPATVHDANGELRRVFVTGQENPHSEYGTVEHHTGYAYLVDADDIFADDFPRGEPYNLGVAERAYQFEGHRNDDDGTDNVLNDHPPLPDDARNELANWVLIAEEEGGPAVEFDNYTLSLHNLSVFETNVGTDADPDYRKFVVAGHYHAGLRVLEFEVGAGSDSSWMTEVAHSRAHREAVPDESKFGGLTAATPDFWCAVESNGVVWTSGINTGVYAFAVDDPAIPVGTAPAITVDVTREGDAVAFTAGMTERYELTLAADEPVELRDRIPKEWTVAGGDVEDVTEVGDGTLVEFGDVQPGESVVYYVDVGGDTGPHTTGPVQYSADGVYWEAIAGTADENLVVGQEQP